jgi:hypothetical protein
MIDLERIEARANAATPRPWEAQRSGRRGKCVAGPGGVIIFCGAYSEYGCGDDANAEFAAHAREDIPALVAEVRRLREATKFDPPDWYYRFYGGKLV